MNTPLDAMTSQELVDLISTSILDDTEINEDLWRNRRIMFADALVRTLVYLRDHEYITITHSKLIEYISFEAIVDLAFHKEGQFGTGFSNASSGLRNFIMTTLRFDKDDGIKIQQATELHTFIVNPLERIFDQLFLRKATSKFQDTILKHP